MAELTFKSAGVSATEIDNSGPNNVGPVGTPAGVIGTANRGPAFVPVTVGTDPDFQAVFGLADSSKFGPLAASSWLQRATALTYVRVLGVGKGEKRTTSGNNIGKVEGGGFVVGAVQPNADGNLVKNNFATDLGDPGRTYFLGCTMSESLGSTALSDAGIQADGTAKPVIRGVLMAASGVIPFLSSSAAASSVPVETDVATAGAATLKGANVGTVNLQINGAATQEFVVLLNGHKGSVNQSYPNYFTASFDPEAPNYFANIMNRDPLKMEEAGYLLYTHYDIHPSFATVTGSGVVAGSTSTSEDVAFITTGSNAHNVGTATAPNYENFEDRFAAASTPWIVSQRFGGNPVNLFKVYSLSDGAFVNDKWKISIENLSPSNSELDAYGTFDLLVRDMDDNDENRVILESYRGLSLDPSSDRYIAKAIGDQWVHFDFDKNSSSQKIVVDGQYPNVSTRIRVEMDFGVENAEVDAKALPSGFRGHAHLVTSGSNHLADVSAAELLKSAVEMPVPFRDSVAIGVAPKKVANKSLYWGVQFERKISVVEPNKSLNEEKTVRSMTKYFPNFMTVNQNMIAGDNAGTPDVDGTILDSDRFNNNAFSLENIQVVTGSNGLANLKTIEDWKYVRKGGLTPNNTDKTRALSVEDDLKVLGVRTLAKFTLHMQGGFDGVNIFNKKTTDLDNSAITEEMTFPARGQDEAPTVRAYRKAIELMEQSSEVDIQLLAIPGIRHPIVTDKAAVAVENRFDAMFIMDLEERDLLNNVVTSSLQTPNIQNTVTAHNNRNFDTSFAAAYFPDVVVTNPQNGTSLIAPPSVAVLGAFALNDSVAYPWFAPAGFTRGVLENAREAAVKLNRDNMDDLYEANINPIVTHPGGPGLTIWGQKTLLATEKALERVNVRRLMLALRRRVRRVANKILFEPNRDETLERFSALVNPILERIQNQAGLNRYRVLIDTSTTTQADIDNNTIRGYIFVEPTKSAEFVKLDFIVSNGGLSI